MLLVLWHMFYSQTKTRILGRSNVCQIYCSAGRDGIEGKSGYVVLTVTLLTYFCWTTGQLRNVPSALRTCFALTKNKCYKYNWLKFNLVCLNLNIFMFLPHFLLCKSELFSYSALINWQRTLRILYFSVKSSWLMRYIMGAICVLSCGYM